MYRLVLIIVHIDDERNHDKGNVYVQGTYSLLYSVVYNICIWGEVFSKYTLHIFIVANEYS
jgi:hypothetical protein